jgi:hypothetical protein
MSTNHVVDRDETQSNYEDFQIQREIAKIMSERMSTAAKQFHDPVPISGLSLPIGSGYVQLRMYLRYLCFASGISCIDGLFVFNQFEYYISAIGIAVGLFLTYAVSGEVFTYAGIETQRELYDGNSYSREYSFTASIGSIPKLLLLFLLGSITVILGFASLYTKLSSLNPTSFTHKLDGIDALCFSIQTYCTASYSDYMPVSSYAKFCVTFETAIALITLSVVIGLLLSWVSNHQQKANEDSLHKRELRMQRTEAIMKIAKIGVYGDLNEIRREARSRLESQSLNDSLPD